MSDNKEFKIAKIVNDFTFFINAGEKDGIEPGDEFEILQSRKTEIKDPDTGEVLGSYNAEKGHIFAKQVFDKYSVCKTKTYTDDSRKPIMPAFEFLAERSKPVVRYEKLEVDMDEITGGTEAEPVKVGDVIKKI